MRAYQKKFFDLLETKLDAITTQSRRYELVLKEQWANTGLAMIQASDSLEPLVSFSYDFQDRNATINFSPRQSKWEPQNQDWFSFYYEPKEERTNTRIKTPNGALEAILERLQSATAWVGARSR